MFWKVCHIFPEPDMEVLFHGSLGLAGRPGNSSEIKTCHVVGQNPVPTMNPRKPLKKTIVE